MVCRPLQPSDRSKGLSLHALFLGSKGVDIMPRLPRPSAEGLAMTGGKVDAKSSDGQ